MSAIDARSALAIVQGVYFTATGVWPLADLDSFERVTGPKVDKWLVRTVGVLVGVIGATLLSAGIRRKVTGETIALAVGSAAGLGLIDAIYAGKGRIARIYLADAAAETALIAAWVRLREDAAARQARLREDAAARQGDR